MAAITLTAGASGCPSGLAPPADIEGQRVDLDAFVRRAPSGSDSIELMVTGAKCAGCISKIERGLIALPGVTEARLNLSTQRLRVAWTPGDRAI